MWTDGCTKKIKLELVLVLSGFVDYKKRKANGMMSAVS